MRSAAAHPDRVDRLVLLGWSLGAPMAKTPMVMPLATVPWIGRALAYVPPTERAVKTILKGAGLGQALASGRFTQDMLDLYRSLLRATYTMRGPDIARSFAAQLPTASLELMRGAGHAVWIDDPDHVGAVAARFLAGRPRHQRAAEPSWRTRAAAMQARQMR